MYSSLLGAVVNIILNVILIPKFLGIGAAIATLIGYMTIWVVNMKNTKKILLINFNLRVILFSLIFIIIEIIFILSETKERYIIAAMCSLGVILFNRRPFYDMFNIIKLKYLKT